MSLYNNLKKCLYLYEFDLDYILFHVNETKKYFDETFQINYADYFKKQGPIALEKKIMENISTNNIDIIFVFIFDNNFEISPDFYNSLRDKCRIVFWLFDDEFLQQTFTRYYAQTADAVIMTDYLGRSYYEKLDIPTVLYFSSYPKKDYFHIETEKKFDVTFIGDVRDERKSYIDFLKNKGVKVNIFGRGSERGPVSMEEMNLIFNKSKINLNFTAIQIIPWIKEFDPLTVKRAKQNKGRPIEIALTKSFCLSEYAPALPYLFKSGDEIDSFRDKEELFEKVNFYLKNDPARERIAANAYKRALSEYESDIYIKKVLRETFEKIENNKKHRKNTIEIYESNFFKKRRLLFFARNIRRSLKKLKIRVALQLFFYLFKNNYSIFKITSACIIDVLKLKK